MRWLIDNDDQKKEKKKHFEDKTIITLWGTILVNFNETGSFQSILLTKSLLCVDTIHIFLPFSCSCTYSR